MNFVEIVESVEEIENKLSSLTEAKLDLVEMILSEGAEITFDVTHHLDYIVEFVNSYSDDESEIITENVNGMELLEIILESVKTNGSDFESAINEAVENANEIDIDIDIDTDHDDNDIMSQVTLLSVVTNTLTEMFGESVVEDMPAEMIFDIVNETKELDISDDAIEMTISEMVTEISESLENALTDGEIDFDSDDYDCETLAEFLDDYEDTEDLLMEMEQVNEEILSEAIDEDGAELMRKAKSAIIILEAKMEKCPPLDKKCMMKKAKNAKAYYAKNTMPGGTDPKDFTLSKLTGKLGKHVKAAAKAARSAGKPLSPEYMQYVLVPGIIKRMRMKNKKMTAKAGMKKVGMK